MSKADQVARYSLPTIVDPPDTVCFIVPCPADKFHVAAFKGQIKALASAYAWANDSAHTARDVAAVWRVIFDNLALCPDPLSPPILGAGGEDENMIRQNPDNPCELQTSIDGANWCTFADFSLCIPAPSQPGGGTEQPTTGGGEACYQGEMPASQLWLLPTIVNTGDVIDLQTVTGAGNDGTVSPWLCPDGTTFFAGGCIGGTGGADGGDPLPTVNHMRLIYLIDGTYYDAMAGPFTVPGGVVNQQVNLLVNDSVLSDNSGSYQFKACVTNNQSASFNHVFDFANDGLSGFSFNMASVISGTPGVFVPGVGIQTGTVEQAAGPEFFRSIRLLRTGIPARTITTWQLFFDITKGPFVGSGEFGLLARANPSGTPVDFVSISNPAMSDGSGQNLLGSGSSPATTELKVEFACSTSLTTDTTSGVATLSKMIVSGLGSDPF